VANALLIGVKSLAKISERSQDLCVLLEKFVMYQVESAQDLIYEGQLQVIRYLFYIH
jgi:hypothetical protein